MNKAPLGLIFVLFASAIACHTSDVISSYMSAEPTPTRTRSPTPPAVSPRSPGVPTPPPTQPLPPPATEVPPVPTELTGTVTENSRVRSSPSTTAAILTRLSKGEQVKVVGRNAESNWYQISLPSSPNAYGWISAVLVQLQGSADALPVVQPGGAPPVQPGAAPTAQPAGAPTVQPGGVPPLQPGSAPPTRRPYPYP